MNRRSFLQGMAAILAAGVAPAVLPSGIIMPVRQLWVPAPSTVHDLRALSMIELVKWYQRELNKTCGLTLQMQGAVRSEFAEELDAQFKVGPARASHAFFPAAP